MFCNRTCRAVFVADTNKEETFGLCSKDHCHSRVCVVAMFMAVFAPPSIHNYSAGRYAFTIAIVGYGYLSLFFTGREQSLCNNVLKHSTKCSFQLQ